MMTMMMCSDLMRTKKLTRSLTQCQS